jgi:hypothetical protein
MKRGTPRHPKVMDLAEKLGCGRPEALGYLELLWDFTAEIAPRGDIGRFSDRRIEAALDWFGRGKPAGKLVKALVEAKWIEVDAECRLWVHDWKDHCDEAVKKKLSRAGLSFHEHVPVVSGQCLDSVETVSAMQDKSVCLPLPLPLPLPSPTPDSASGAANPRPPKSWYDQQHEKWYSECYWTHVGKDDSRRAFEKRVNALVISKGMTTEAAVEFLREQAVLDRWRSEANVDVWSWRKKLHPATWLNGARWEDEVAGGEKAPSQIPRLVFT